MIPVGGIVRLGTPVSRVGKMVLLYMEAASNQHDYIDGPLILSNKLCDSKLWVIKLTEKPLDTNIPILVSVVCLSPFFLFRRNRTYQVEK